MSNKMHAEHKTYLTITFISNKKVTKSKAHLYKKLLEAILLIKTAFYENNL